MNVVELELNSKKLEVDGNLRKENLKLLNQITPILAVTAGINIQIIILIMLWIGNRKNLITFNKNRKKK